MSQASSDTPPSWVVPVMRAGYGARALTYAVLGSLTILAALYGGEAEGTTGALEDLRSGPFGTALLWVIAAGLLAYAVWRLLAAWYDLERRGDDSSGRAKRGGLLVTGLIHAGLAVSVAGLAMGGSEGGDSTQDWTARLMQLPWGRYVAGAAGVITIGAGIHYLLKGIKGKYKRTMRVTPLTQRLDPVMKAGFIAQGVVIAVIGVLVLTAAIRLDSSEAGGVGAALTAIRSVAYGRILLGMIGLGLVAFAVENAIEAWFRIVPRCAGPDIETMAMRAKAKARDATR